MEVLTLLLIVGAVVIVLVAAVIILLILRKKYSLNWFQRSVLENGGKKNFGSTSSVVKIIKVKSKRFRDESTESDTSDEGSYDSQLLLPPAPVTKSLGFVQPEAAGARIPPHIRDIEMGAEESSHAVGGLASRPKLQAMSHIPHVGSRRNSAPVVYGRVPGLGRVMSAPLGIPVLNTVSEEEHTGHKRLDVAKSFPHKTDPPSSSDKGDKSSCSTADSDYPEFVDPLPQGRHAKRRTSMQDEIDVESFNPALYRKLDRNPTIKEEASIDINEPIGTVFLSLNYNPDSKILKVTVHKADLSGFPAYDVFLKKPYFALFIKDTPDITKRFTKPSENAQHPVIEEVLLFEVGEVLAGKRLVCQLYDHDQFIKTDPVGFIEVRLKTIPHNETVPIQKHIERARDDHHFHDAGYVGELLFSANYHKPSEKFNIVVTKAKDLHIEDELAVRGLIVKATALHQSKKIKKKSTDIVKISTCPSWNEALSLTLPSIPLQELSLVMDVCKDKIGRTEVIGRVTLSCEAEGKELEHWTAITSSNQQMANLEWWHQLRKVEKDST